MLTVFFLFKMHVCFIILAYLVPVLFTFYIHGVLKLKKNNSSPQRLTKLIAAFHDFANALKNFYLLLRETAPLFLRVFNSVIAHLHEA